MPTDQTTEPTTELLTALVDYLSLQQDHSAAILASFEEGSKTNADSAKSLAFQQGILASEREALKAVRAKVAAITPAAGGN